MPAPMTPPDVVYESFFAHLAAARSTTAVDFLPLVMWQDVVGRDEQCRAYRHHDFFSLYVVRQGRGTHVIDGIPYAVARGDVYAMGLGQMHWFRDCDALVTDTLHFAPQIFDGRTLEVLTALSGFQSLFVEEPLRRERNGGRWLHLTPERHALVSEALAELHAEWLSGTPEGALLTQALFLRLLVHLARDHTQQGPRQTILEGAHDATVAAAVEYLENHFTEALRITDVAARVFLSPDRFTEIFSSVMGRTPRDYLGHLRLERAKTLLRSTRHPISVIGLESGFGDAPYFTRVFHAATGLTPTEFRRGNESEDRRL